MDDDNTSLMDKMSAGIAAKKFRACDSRPGHAGSHVGGGQTKTRVGGFRNLIAGSRYHNRKDLISFPDFGREDAVFQRRKRVQHPLLKGKSSLIQQVLRKDILLNYPYHDFGHVVDLMREAAIDPAVESIHINLYRVRTIAHHQRPGQRSAQRQKGRGGHYELYARFDEKNNIRVSNVLQEAGSGGFGSRD